MTLGGDLENVITHTCNVCCESQPTHLSDKCIACHATFLRGKHFVSIPGSGYHQSAIGYRQTGL